MAQRGEQMDGQTENSTGLHPVLGHCPASPNENQRELEQGANHLMPLGYLLDFLPEEKGRIRISFSGSKWTSSVNQGDLMKPLAPFDGRTSSLNSQIGRLSPVPPKVWNILR